MVVADGHFEWGREKGSIKGVQFLVPFSEPRGCKRKLNDDKNEKKKLNDLQIHYNELVRAVHARVESPFGLLKQRFRSLEKPFPSSEKQLNNLVLFASAVENKKRIE